MQLNQLYLALAIVSEVIATSALKASDGLQKWQPTLVVVLGYFCAFYLLGLALRTIPLGVAYAIWCGVGIVLLSLMGWLLYNQRLGHGEIIGIALIATGVVVLQVFSH